MPYPKAEERASEPSIQTTPLSQKITDNIDILPNILTDLEYGVFTVLEHYKSPSTTKEIRTNYIAFYSDFIVEKVETTDHKRYFTAFEKTTTEKELKKYANDLTNFVKKQTRTRRELISFMEKKLRELGINIPAYETFDNILLSLEKLGIVGRRYDPIKKGKWLWLLSPNFLIALKEKKKS